MKGNKPHIVPLSSLALAVLERQARVRVSDAVFPGRASAPISYPGFASTVQNLDFDIGTPHSWRSIFRDWASDIARVDRDLAEAALAHALDETESAYRRGSAIEARRAPMQKYANWLTDEAGATVVPFAARA